MDKKAPDSWEPTGDSARDRIGAALVFSDAEEALLQGGLSAVLAAKLDDPERVKALAFESAQRDPDAALAVMNVNTRGSFSEKPWAVELYRLAAEAATRPDMIFLAFPWIERKEGAIDILETIAQKHPVAVVKNLNAYRDHPKAEAIFKAAMAASAEAQSAGQEQISLWGSTEPNIIKKYPWMQEIYIDALLAQKPHGVIHAAKRFGDLPWFRRAIDELPKLITTLRDLDWCLWQVTSFGREFPRGVATAIKVKLDTVKF